MAATDQVLSGLHSVFHSFGNAPASASVTPSSGSAVGQLTAIGDLVINREVAEWHAHQDEWQDKLSTTLSVEDLELEAVFIGTEAHHATLRNALISGTTQWYGISYTPPNDYENGVLSRFQAIVTNYSRMAPIDDKVSIKVTLCITGQVNDETLVEPPSQD